MTRLCRQMHERGFICYRCATRRLLEENSYAAVKSGSFMAAAWRRAAAVGCLRRAASQVLRLRAALGSAWWASLAAEPSDARAREREREKFGGHAQQSNSFGRCIVPCASTIPSIDHASSPAIIGSLSAQRRYPIVWFTRHSSRHSAVGHL